MRNSVIGLKLAVVALVVFTMNCESTSSSDIEAGEDASTTDKKEVVDRDGSDSKETNDADGSSESSDAGGSAEGSGNGGDAVARCEGAECCWTDCISGEETCGEFEPLEECSNVEVPAWFELHSCVVDYDSLEPFTEDARQGIGYCACYQADQVATAEIPIEEIIETGCIYTFGGDPCGYIDLSVCFPETDAGTGTSDAGSSTSTSECSSDSSCGYRQICRDGKCVTVQCTSDSQCGSCSRCSSNVCRSCGYGPYGCYC
jgi:hypothetical protein